jgi:hypothetical protein
VRIGPALAAVETRLPKDFHGRSWDAISIRVTVIEGTHRLVKGFSGALRRTRAFR